MEKRKVLFISAANSTHTVKWVNALSEYFEIHLVYCCNHKPNADAINKNIVLHELKFKSPLGYYFNSLQLKKLYKQIRPDVVNVHYASGYGTLARIAKLKNILLSVWGSDVYDFPNESKLKKKILQKNVMYASAIASTSNVMAEKLKKQVPMLKKEIYITPFGVDIDKFKKLDYKNQDDKFIVGNIKTLNNSVYGIDIGILAIKDLRDRLIKNNELDLANKILFYIYGDGVDKENLHKLIEDNNLKDIIYLKDRIPNEEVPEALSSIDVFCITSHKESFGVAVVEAMACEVPVIATDTEGFIEVMENGKTGYIVEKGNVNQISYKLEQLLRDKDSRKKFGENGRKRVINLYNWNNNVQYMKQIYNKIISKNKGEK